MRAILSLARKLLPGPSPSGQSRQLVFLGELAGEVNDPWMKRVIALADGRPVEAIAQALYLEELRAGAEMADIGLWRNLFLDQVAQTLKVMSDQGYIRLVTPDPPESQ